MPDVERDAEFDVFRAGSADGLRRIQHDGQMPVRHSEVRQDRVDRVGESLGARAAQLGERHRPFIELRSRFSLARLQLTNIESRRVDEIELGARVFAGTNDVGKRAAVLLGEAENEITPAAYLVEPSGIQLDRRFVLLEL